MQLIDNASRLLKMASVQLAGLTGLLAVAEQVLPQLQGQIPPGVYGALSVLIIVARAIKQPSVSR